MRVSIKNTMLALAAAAGLMAMAGAAQATNITVTGTANSTALGYTAGQSYSFVYDLGSGFDAVASSIQSGTGWATMAWSDKDAATSPQLYNGVSGPGLSGTYTHTGPWDWATVTVSNSNHTAGITLAIDSPTGLKLNGNDFTQIVYEGHFSGNFPILPPIGSQAPNAYFQSMGLTGFTGTNRITIDGGGSFATFNVTALSIEGGASLPSSAVPLPAAAWSGLVLLAGLGLKRLRRR